MVELGCVWKSFFAYIFGLIMRSTCFKWLRQQIVKVAHDLSLRCFQIISVNSTG